MNKERFQETINTGLSTLAYGREKKAELLERIRIGNIRKRNLSFALAFGICIVLLLSGIAAASHFGLLSFLFGDREQDASEALLHIIQPIEMSSEADNIRIKVNDGLCDGQRFIVSWEIENLNPTDVALVEVESVSINGAPANCDNITTNNQIIPPPFQWPEGPGASMSGGMQGYMVEGAQHGICDISITFAISRPVGEFAVVDAILFESLDGEWEQWRTAQLERILDAGVPVAGKDEMDPETWAEKGYTVILANGRVLPMTGAFISNGCFLERPGQWMKSGEINMTFSLDPQKAEAYARKIEPVDPVTINGYVITMNEILLSPVSTTVDLECTSVQGPYRTMDEYIANGANHLPWIAFADEEGVMIEYTNLGWEAGWNMNVLEDGSINQRMQQTFPALRKPPHYLVFLDSFSRLYGLERIDASADSQSYVALPIRYMTDK